MRTYSTFLLLLALAFAPVRAQWTFLGPSTITHYVDVAAGNGVLLAAANPGSPPRVTYGSTNGGTTWEEFYNSGGTRSIVALDTGFILQIGGQGMRRGDATGRVWTTIPGPGANVVRFYYDRSTRKLYATTQRSGLLVSADQGVTWTSLGVPSEDLTFVHARGNRIITGYNNINAGGWFSTNGGETWEGIKVDAGVPAGGFVGTDGEFYVITTEGLFPAYGHLWRGSESDAQWTKLTKERQDIHGVSIQMQAQVYAEGEKILFTTGTDVWMSGDGGATWGKNNDGLPPSSNRHNFTRMIFDGGYIYMVLQAFVSPEAINGIYRRPIAELGFSGAAASVRNGAASPATALTIALAPRHGAATISLTLGHQAATRVTLHDMLGRTVALLHDAPLDAGRHDIPWSGDLPSGIYLLRVDAGGTTRSQAFTHVR